MTEQQLENAIVEYLINNGYNTSMIGKFIIQPVYFSEDENGNILYDTDETHNEFKGMIGELEEHNLSSDYTYSWE